MNYRILSQLKSPWPNSIIRNLLMCDIPPPTPDFKVGHKVFVKAQFFQTTWSSKKLSEKYLGPYEIITQPDILSFTLCLPESICSIHPVFYVSMLKPTMSNSFFKRTQLAPTSVIIDRESEYEISQIVYSKINH